MIRPSAHVFYWLPLLAAATVPSGHSQEDKPAQDTVIHAEWFEIDQVPLTELLLETPPTFDGGALYRKVLDLAKTSASGVRLAESALVRVGEDQIANTSSVLEYTYPTTVTSLTERSGNAPSVPATPTGVDWATPASFEQRDIGLKFFVEPTTQNNGNFIRVILNTEMSGRTGDAVLQKIPFGSDFIHTIKVPEFYSLKNASTLTVGNRSTSFAGILDTQGTAGSGDTDKNKKLLCFIHGSTVHDETPAWEKPWGADSQIPLTVQAEIIEIDQDEIAPLLRRNPPQHDSTILRKAINRLITTGRATLSATPLIQTRSGQHATCSATNDISYGTNFAPAEGRAADSPPVPAEVSSIDMATPTTFSTKGLGTTMKLNPTVWDDGAGANIRLAIQIVGQVGEITLKAIPVGDRMHPTIRQPLFYKNTLETIISIKDGGYALAGIMSPASDGKRNPDKKYLAFIRLSIGSL